MKAATAQGALRAVGGACHRGGPREPSSWVQKGYSQQRKVFWGCQAASPLASLAKPFSHEQKSWGSWFWSGNPMGKVPGEGDGVLAIACRALWPRVRSSERTSPALAEHRAVYICLEGRRVGKHRPLHPGSLLVWGYGENPFARGSCSRLCGCIWPC